MMASVPLVRSRRVFSSAKAFLAWAIPFLKAPRAHRALERLAQVEQLVEKGIVKTKEEAFEEGLKLFLKSHKAQELRARIDGIREQTEAVSSVTEAAIRSHEDEDF